MNSPSVLDTYRVSTLGAPPAERFDAWAAASGSWSFAAPDDRSVPFDCQFDATRVGPYTMGRRTWLNPDRNVAYGMARTARQIRADGLDHYYLLLHLGGSITWQFGKRTVDTRPGGLYLIDTAHAFDCIVRTGDTVIVTLPRDLFHPDTAKLHGWAMAPAMGGILADYLLAFHDNLTGLSAAQVPYLTQATTNLLHACVQPCPDTLMQAGTEIDAALRERARSYIEQHLTDPGLCPDAICKAIGVSRPKLYRLFQPDGGVMKLVQRTRLVRIRNRLADPTRPRARISDLAWRYGFASDKHFSRSFKAEFGHSPRETIEQPPRHSDEASLAPVAAAPRRGPADATFSDWIVKGNRRAA
ncbi:AraC family transcriptional regulator [Burkholderia aenigmatica]|uniref:AraC family transcriptional regulator n=1 Tax=Burkholderia aenigmatica TaxID=2015348 RepID=A0A6J5J3L3_9BURK|nr:MULTISPECIES: helix-turn-helix domain-containing protein [Burkholderia]CAB3966179.1 AraC family transcriptional regulator [Burkholderia aenigmatica]